MVALNFTMFVDKVEKGTKRQTIRRDTQARPGCTLQLFTGQRTKSCRKLRPDEICKSVHPVILMEKLAQPLGNTVIMGYHLEDFAKADGFDCYADMWQFFRKRAVDGEFNGFLIKW